jgi:transcriptional regulator of acetoin/glycerol metabolism
MNRDTHLVVSEISRHRDRLAKAESQVTALRDARDALISHCHEAGVPVTRLAQDAGISRVTVYEAIRRHRRNDG